MKMNEEVFDILQGRGEASDFEKHFPEIAMANRCMSHRPSGPGMGFGQALLVDLQDKITGSEESIFNDPEMLQDYLN